jgi:hypothetical protein
LRPGGPRLYACLRSKRRGRYDDAAASHRQDIGNPSAGSAAVTVTYLLPDGTSIDKTHQVAGQSRLTISVKDQDTRLAATAVSATITSTNATPIVVERAMWWPSPGWYEGTVTAAATQTATRWALAGGHLDHRPDTETYLLIANPGTTAANVAIGIGRNGISGPNVSPVHSCRLTVPVPAHGRYTVGLRSRCAFAMNDAFPTRVAGTVESDGPPIVVEEAGRDGTLSLKGTTWQRRSACPRRRRVS